MSGVGDNTILNWTAELNEFEQQLADIQKSKKDFYARVRDEHGKKVAASLKEAVRLYRMDSTKRLEAEEIDAEAFRILQVIERGPSRAAHVRVENIEEFDAETGEIAEPADAAVTVGNDLREPVAAEQGQIIREGDAPREADNGEALASTYPDTEFKNAPEPSNRDVSAGDEPSPEAGPQAEASPSREQETGTLAGHEGVSEGEAAPAGLPTNSTIIQFNRDETTEERCLGLRPHCLNPSACAGVGKNHCFGCRKAVTSMTGEPA